MMAPPQRGLTMIEVLVALTLLSALMLAVATWTGVTATTGVGLTRDLQWRTAADNVLQLIADDCVIGDLDARNARSTGAPSGASEVELDGSTLRIVTRSAANGPIDHVYVYDPFTKRLSLRSQSIDVRRGSTTRPLLNHILTWRCEFEDPATPLHDQGSEDDNNNDDDDEQTSPPAPERVLVVTIVMRSESAADSRPTIVSRRYRLS